jgi:ABC-type sugar transport system substrate-binding protein
MVIGIIVTSVLVGCNKNKGTTVTQQTESAKPFTLGCVWQEAGGNNLNVRQAIEVLASERGYKTISIVYDRDNEKCLMAVQSLISQNVDAIFAYVIDAGVQKTIQERCAEADVYCAFTGLMEADSITICDNEFEEGKFGAEKLIAGAERKWGKDFEADLVILLEGTDAGEGNRIRMHEAIQPTIAERFPSLREEDFYWIDCGIDILQASSDVANTLAARPRAKHILIATFVDLSAQGAMNALISAGREKDACVVTYHFSDDATMNYVKNYSDTWIGNCYFPGESYAIPLFEQAVDIWAKGGKVENGLLYSQYVWVDKSNVDGFTFSFQKK